jgi:hypothetical protein
VAVALAEILRDAAADLEDVDGREAGGEVTWSIRGVPFVVATPGTADFLFDPVVARAALGTPDTSPSRRGAGWIAFAPRELDQYAVDRATSWFGASYRVARDGRGVTKDRGRVATDRGGVTQDRGRLA